MTVKSLLSGIIWACSRLGQYCTPKSTFKTSFYIYSFRLLSQCLSDHIVLLHYFGEKAPVYQGDISSGYCSDISGQEESKMIEEFVHMQIFISSLIFFSEVIWKKRLSLFLISPVSVLRVSIQGCYAQYEHFFFFNSYVTQNDSRLRVQVECLTMWGVVLEGIPGGLETMDTLIKECMKI